MLLVLVYSDTLKPHSSGEVFPRISTQILKLSKLPKFSASGSMDNISALQLVVFCPPNSVDTLVPNVSYYGFISLPVLFLLQCPFCLLTSSLHYLPDDSYLSNPWQLTFWPNAVIWEYCTAVISPAYFLMVCLAFMLFPGTKLPRPSRFSLPGLTRDF